MYIYIHTGCSKKHSLKTNISQTDIFTAAQHLVEHLGTFEEGKQRRFARQQHGCRALTDGGGSMQLSCAESGDILGYYYILLYNMGYLIG